MTAARVPFFIVVADHQRVVVSGEADVDAVQLVHHDAAAADGGGLQLQLLAVGVPDLDDRRVGVGRPAGRSYPR